MRRCRYAASDSLTVLLRSCLTCEVLLRSMSVKPGGSAIDGGQLRCSNVKKCDGPVGSRIRCYIAYWCCIAQTLLAAASSISLASITEDQWSNSMACVVSHAVSSHLLACAAVMQWLVV